MRSSARALCFPSRTSASHPRALPFSGGQRFAALYDRARAGAGWCESQARRGGVSFLATRAVRKARARLCGLHLAPALSSLSSLSSSLLPPPPPRSSCTYQESRSLVCSRARHRRDCLRSTTEPRPPFSCSSAVRRLIAASAPRPRSPARRPRPPSVRGPSACASLGTPRSRPLSPSRSPSSRPPSSPLEQADPATSASSAAPTTTTSFAMPASDSEDAPVRPFACSFECEKAFARKSDLERHERIHKGVRSVSSLSLSLAPRGTPADRAMHPPCLQSVVVRVRGMRSRLHPAQRAQGSRAHPVRPPPSLSASSEQH